jgi:hypothetical protein
MRRPFGYIIYLEHGNAFFYRSLDEAEQALREFVATLVVGHCADDEIILTLEECGEHVRVFACTTELEPFARKATAA